MQNDERCENCRPAVQVETLLLEVTSLKEKVSKLETSTAVNEEQTKMVFKILNEIKESIKGIADNLSTIEKKPAQRWEEAIRTVIAVLITSAVTYLISKK
jgi:hypothetical protein